MLQSPKLAHCCKITVMRSTISQAQRWKQLSWKLPCGRLCGETIQEIVATSMTSEKKLWILWLWWSVAFKDSHIWLFSHNTGRFLHPQEELLFQQYRKETSTASCPILVHSWELGLYKQGSCLHTLKLVYCDRDKVFHCRGSSHHRSLGAFGPLTSL